MLFFSLSLSPSLSHLALASSLACSLSISLRVYNAYTSRKRDIARGGVSNLIEIPLCEIVEKSSHAIAGVCAKIELQEETRFVR